MLSTEEIVGFLKDNKSFLKEQFHCTEIGLFGSFARNEQNENSDIDILVVFEPGISNLYELELNLKNFLIRKFKRPVDICAKKWISPIFRPHVLKEAIYA